MNFFEDRSEGDHERGKEKIRVFRKNYKFSSDELAGDDIDVVYTNDGGFKFQFLFNFQFELEPGKPGEYHGNTGYQEDPYSPGKPHEYHHHGHHHGHGFNS